MTSPLKLVVLISGNGSNLNAIIKEIEQGRLNAKIAQVISNRPNAYGLTRAQQADIPNSVIDHEAYDSREAFDQALIQFIDRHQPDLIVLAGFMRILSDAFVEHYMGKLINIHPSLLPAFAGTIAPEPQAAALRAGVKQARCTVHLVTTQLDARPIVAQAAVPVLPDDTVESLSARILGEEHRLFPQVLQWFADGRVSVIDGVARVLPAGRD